MTPPRRVRVPLSRRLLHWRTRVVVCAFWLVCLAGVVSLSRVEFRQVQALGLVETHDWAISTVMPARIAEIRTQLMAPVEAGQVLVTLDSSSYESELAVLEAQILLARADLESMAERIRLDAARLRQALVGDERQLTVDYEEARLDYLALQVEVEVDRVKLQQVEANLRRQDELSRQGVVSQAIIEDLSLLKAELETRIRENTILAEVKQLQSNERRERLNWVDASTAESGVVALMEPLRANIDRQHERVQLVLSQKREYVLTAPISGVVTRILHRPGEAVLAGDWILTISQPASTRVVAYLDDRVTSRVREGDRAMVQAANGTGARISGSVAHVGPAVIDRPLQLLSQPNILEWGVPVVIVLDDQQALRPGQRVRVSILPG